MDQERKDFLTGRIDACPFNRLNGIRAVSVEEGRAVAEAVLEESSMNIWGVPHGGLLFALGDVASGLASHLISRGKVVTVSGNINFLAAGQNTKYLRAEAEVIREGHSTIFIGIMIRDDADRPVAAGQYVMHRMQERE